MVSSMKGTKSMACRLLKRHGFYRNSRKPVFIRHTVGIGGIYVEILTRGYQVTVRDLQEVTIFSKVSELKQELKRLDEIESRESMNWKQRILQFEKEHCAESAGNSSADGKAIGGL